MTEQGPAPGEETTAEDFYAQNRDADGLGLKQAEKMSLKDHYERAGRFYEAHNQFYAEVQTQIRSELWKDKATTELAPADGGSTDRGPRDSDLDNSYYFETFRWFDPGDIDRDELIERVEQDWSDHGWKVERQDIAAAVRCIANTDDGYWLEIFQDPHQDRIELTIQSPLYYGPYMDLLSGIVDRMNAETAAGVFPDYEHTRDENEVADRTPGDHDDFPAWDTYDKYPPVHDSEEGPSSP